MSTSRLLLRAAAARLARACSGGSAAGGAAAASAAASPSVAASLQPAWRQQLSASAGALMLAADALAVTAAAGAGAARPYWAAALAAGSHAARPHQQAAAAAAAVLGGRRWSSSAAEPPQLPPPGPPPQQQQAPFVGQQVPGAPLGCQAPPAQPLQQALFDRQLLVDTLATVGGWVCSSRRRSSRVGWALPRRGNGEMRPAHSMAWHPTLGRSAAQLGVSAASWAMLHARALRPPLRRVLAGAAAGGTRPDPHAGVQGLAHGGLWGAMGLAVSP